VEGVIIQTVRASPAGTAATQGKRIKMHYVGKLQKNGKVFDSSDKPFSFRLGVGEVIRGWDIGIVGMRVGEKRVLTIPPEKGYGRAGAGPKIPPNATLVFDVTCIDVSK
jgi:FK506-binding nuclear protein